MYVFDLFFLYDDAVGHLSRQMEWEFPIMEIRHQMLRTCLRVIPYCSKGKESIGIVTFFMIPSV